MACLSGYYKTITITTSTIQCESCTYIPVPELEGFITEFEVALSEEGRDCEAPGTRPCDRVDDWLSVDAAILAQSVGDIEILESTVVDVEDVVIDGRCCPPVDPLIVTIT